jgi:hypothetical protein
MLETLNPGLAEGPRGNGTPALMGEQCMADDDLVVKGIRESIVFLRMAAIQLRQIAARSEPDIAQQLRHMADQSDAEANDYTKRFGIDPLQSN